MGSRPAEITLYVGGDSDGIITTGDRFMGTPVDTRTYSGGETRYFDVTALVNAVLSKGEFFAARLEATAAPDTLRPDEYYGGQFLPPSLEFTAGAAAIPEPGTLVLLAAGLAGISLRRRRA
ncbi:MAG: PEP-CTERM sorting domain-containing protein [Burkholderiales bacterium]